VKQEKKLENQIMEYGQEDETREKRIAAQALSKARKMSYELDFSSIQTSLPSPKKQKRALKVPKKAKQKKDINDSHTSKSKGVGKKKEK